MEDKEFEITGSLFGGYNKKQTEVYIQELQKMIEELQSELEAAEAEGAGLKQNLAEAENCYKVLWERSKGQEETIKSQAGAIGQQKKTIENQKMVIENQNKAFLKQGQLLEGQLKKALGVPSDKLEKMMKKQFKKLEKKLKKKLKKKEVH